MTASVSVLAGTASFSSRLSDRAGLSLFGSLLVHLILVFGIRFVLVSEQSVPTLPTLRLTIVNTLTEDPIEPTALAQHSQAGSGTESTSDVATTPLPMPRNYLLLESEASINQKLNPKIIQSTEWITASDSHLTLLDGKATTKTKASVTQNTTNRVTTLAINSLIPGGADTLYQQSPERKRHTFITSSTSESVFAAYMEIWRVKVEQIGTLNYPEVAKRLTANGTVVLDVAVGRDGSLQETRLVKSSGNKLLDDAAIRIARLAAPFDPLPEKILRHTDILHITRTWQFQNDAHLITR